jgi:hypothetical protein
MVTLDAISRRSVDKAKHFNVIKQQNEFIETLIIAASLRDIKAHVRGAIQLAMEKMAE